ncbi:MAG: hypothetical protein IT426_15425 [Pirellulales bacterium]|nr:hypothetical protein [Pirellulales bacterium]
MEPSENPYASPTADLTAPFSMTPEIADAEAIRKKYLSHEASVQSIGILYWLGSIVCFVALFFMSYMIVSRGGNFGFETLFGLLYLGIAVLGLWLGYGFRKLDSRVRIPAGILAALGLLQIPIGTLINAYILYLIFSAKGKMVFSPEYKEIIRQTPHIKYRTSLVSWILLILVLALLAIGISMFLVSGR